MASIGIIITQSGVPGVHGESREDLVVNLPVTLRNFSSVGITSYKWELAGKPYTSLATLSSTSSSVVSFTPDVVGSYLIQLTINNKLKQSVVAAILTSRHGIRIPASGEGEEISGGSFKAITESIRTLESDSLNAAMIQGESVSLNEPGLNDFLRYNGEEWIPSGKVRSDDLGFRNTQNILVKIPLSSAIQANPYWEYNAEVGVIKPCWKTISSGGELPILDFLWNSFPHGSVLKKVYVIVSCENPSSNQLTIRVEKNGAIWSSDQITSFVDQFVSTTQHTVSSNTGVTLSVSENTEFTHGNSNDSVVTSEELKIRLTADGTNTFRIFGIYVHFQTLSVGLYNGPLVAEGGGGEGQEDGGGCCFSPAPFDFVLIPTLLTEEQNGEYFFSVGSPSGNGQITLPLEPTSGMQFTIMCMGSGITIDGNGTPMGGPMGLSWGAYVIGLEPDSSVTITAKDFDLLSPGMFAWVITGGFGEFFNNDNPTERFNFNFNQPSNFTIDSSAELLGWSGSSGIVRMNVDLYGTKLAGTQQHSGGTPVDVGPTEVWKLIESGRSDATGTSPVVCTLDDFAMINDDGWECTFMVGVDSALDPVPMTVKCPTFVDELCIEGARYVNSITASTPGSFVRIKYSGGAVGRGKFEVLAGRGTWTDNLAGVHNLSGAGGHNPVTLNDSSITGGLSLVDQEISFRAADTNYDGYLKSDDWDTFNSKEPAQTKGSISSGTTSAIIVSNGSSATVGPNTSITINKASASFDGYLGKDNWATFNSKEPAQTKGSISETGSSVLTVSNGTGSTVGPNVTVQVKKASASQDGYLGKDDFVAFSSGGHNPVTLSQSAITGGLSLNNQEISFRAVDTNYDGYLKSADWDTFNSKEPALSKGNLTETSSGILIFGGTTTNNVIGSGTTIRVKKASALQDGYLGKDDFATFAAGGGGGDGYWSRDSINGYLRPTTTTDVVMADKIGVGVSSINSSAIIDVVSTTKGILPPRMTTTQRNAIVSPAAGLQIFNTTTGKDNTYNGSSWEEVASGDISSWSGLTTNAVETELFLGGVTNSRYTMQSNSTTVFQLLCVARDGTNNKSKVWKIEAVSQRDSSNSSALVGTPSYTVIAQSDISGGTNDWDISVSVDDTDETFRVSVTGATSTTINWTIRG